MREENIRTFGALMERKGEVRLPASGYSMYPYILPGDECLFIPIKGPLKIGQVGLVACDTGILYSHRLHRIKEGKRGIRYIFRGDANRFYDPAVTPEQVIGILIELKRRGTILPEERLFRRLWSFLCVRWTALLLPFVLLGRWKKGAVHNRSAEKGRTSWRLFYRKE